jgi:hypothetical protein
MPWRPSCRSRPAARRCCRAASAAGRTASCRGVRPAASNSPPGIGDHRGIVGAQPQRRRGEGAAGPLRRPPRARRAGHVRRHPAGDGERRVPPGSPRGRAPRASGLFRQHVAHRRLEPGAEIGAVLRASARPAPPPAHRAGAARGLQPGKRQVAAGAVQQRARKGEPRRVAVACRRLHRRAARLRQAQQRAVLSKASPGASSMVPPRRVKSAAAHDQNWQCPPETSSMR